jgi:hypothetical protein
LIVRFIKQTNILGIMTNELASQPQNIVAILADFDGTLAPGYAPDHILRHYGYEPQDFWDVKEELHTSLKEMHSKDNIQNMGISEELLYLNMFFDEKIFTGLSKSFQFPDLSRKLLKELGGDINFFPGALEFIPELREYIATKPEWKEYDIKLEFYVVSTAPADMIRGSAIAPHVDRIHASEVFAADRSDNGKIKFHSNPVTRTGKTRAVYSVSKGFEYDADDYLPEPFRRVHKQMMMGLVDGATDRAITAALNDYSPNSSIGVFPRGNRQKHRNTSILLDEERVIEVLEADYTQESPLIMRLEELIDKKVGIVRSRRDAVVAAYQKEGPRY